MNKRAHTTVVSKLAILAAVSLTAFNNNAGWKVDGDGKLVTDDKGNPVYVDSAGKEMSVQSNTISRLNDESRTHRLKAEQAEQRLQAFGDLDPTKAREAIEKMGKIDLSKMVENGELDRVKAEITSQFTEQLTAKDAALKEVTGRADSLTRQLAFAGSEFINKRVAVPRDMFEATFGNNFKIEDGKIIPYGKDGNKIMSPTRFGEIATVDEAFEVLVGQHPNKDAILKADAHSGSGSDGSGGNRGSGSTISRADFEKMTPADRAKAAAEVGKGELKIV